MNTLDAYARAQMAFAVGHKHRVFDWHKAAHRIKEVNPQEAGAGLQDDWEWTGGPIFKDGEPVPKENTYTYLSSNHAAPELELDGKLEECWIYQEDSPGWIADTYWPQSALDILDGESE